MKIYFFFVKSYSVEYLSEEGCTQLPRKSFFYSLILMILSHFYTSYQIINERYLQN